MADSPPSPVISTQIQTIQDNSLPETPELLHWTRLSVAIIVVLGSIPMLLNLGVPFLHRDVDLIAANGDLHRLWPILPCLSVGTDVGTIVRPLVGLTLAANYAISGLQVWSYHAFNALLHLSSALLVYGIVRRTLMPRKVQDTVEKTPLLLALAIAVLWAVHPLQMQIVVPVIHRGELLAGWSVLLSLYCFIRSWNSIRPPAWLAGSIAACILGQFSGTTAVGLPLIILLYDRAFINHSANEALRKNRLFYAALGLCWLIPPLLWLVSPSILVIGTVPSISGLNWMLTQVGLVLAYLRQCWWPRPFVVYPDWSNLPGGGELWLRAGAAVLLFIISVYTLMQRPRLGFLAGTFFVLLLPHWRWSPPLSDWLPVSNMYLPLACVIILTILFLTEGVNWLSACLERIRLWPPRVALGLLVIAVAGLIRTDVQRMEVYQTVERYWNYVEGQAPNLAVVQDALGRVWQEKKDHDQAIARFNTALAFDPLYAPARLGLADCYLFTGEVPKAFEQYDLALKNNPKYAPTYNQLGVLLTRIGHYDEAEERFQQAIKINPRLAMAFSNRGHVLFLQEKYKEAVIQHRRAVELDVTNAEFHYKLGLALLRKGELEEAQKMFYETQRLMPGHPGARLQLWNVRELMRQASEKALLEQKNNLSTP